MPTLPDDLRDPFDRFVRGPAILRACLDGLEPGTLNRRPRGSDWSIRDVIVHITDNELMQAVRFRLVIAGTTAPLPVIEQELWKRRLHYLWRDPEAAIALYQQTRYSSGELLQQCDRESWSRSGECPESGTVTLADLLRSAADHTEAQVERIIAFRS